jgi:hypothetical protein
MRQSLQRHHNNQSGLPSPIRVFAIGIEHALDVPIER